MKIVCSKTDLLKSLNISMRAVPSKTTMPILECILINCLNGKIVFVTNDTDIGIETVVNGIVIEKGIVALNAKIFFEIIRRLPENDIIIESDEKDNTLITCEKARFSISGRNGKEFVYLPLIEKEEPLELNQFILKNMITQTIFSIAQNENNRMMTGELFQIEDNQMRIVSLDGHRISIRKIILPDGYPNRKVIVPGKALNELSKILSDEVEDKIDIYFSNNHILFELDQTILISRLIEGDYFRIDNMLSKKFDTKISIRKRDFQDSIDRATLFVKEGDKKPIVITIHDQILEMSIKSPMGSMEEEVNIDKTGLDIVIGFNPKFLMDALKVIDDEIIDLYMANPKAPCFIRNEEDSYIYLILPVNINQNII